MSEYPRISIVTPNLNGAAFIEQAINSVLRQNYPNLEYIVIDGGSTDASVEIIGRYRQHLTCFESAPDNGVYDAINKGFLISTGEIMGYLNSDDMLHPGALGTIAEVFSLNSIEWIQGYNTWFDAQGRTFYAEPFRTLSKIAYYLRDFSDQNMAPFIQQESTFWRRSLWERAGGYISADYKFAGDFELWMRFFCHADLYLTNSLLGGFRYHDGKQVSRANYDKYMLEAHRIAQLSLPDEKSTRAIRQLRFLKKYDWLERMPVVGPRFRRRVKKLYGSFPLVSWHSGKSRFEIFRND